MKSKGFALMTVLIIVIIVPIVVFGVTAFITSSVSRHDAQARKMAALYLAQSGIHQAIYKIKETGPLSALSVHNFDENLNNTIAVTVADACSNLYQLDSVGTSLSSGNSISRSVFAQYDSTANKVSYYYEGDHTGAPALVCCTEIWWPFSEGAGSMTGTAPYVGTLVNGPLWVAGRVGTALRFNTTPAHRYVTVPDSSGLDLTTEGTVMAWIYNTAQINTNSGIVHKGDRSNSSDEAYGLTITRNGSNRRIKFELRDTGGTSRNVTANTNLALNTWYHVAGTWGPAGLKVYINGSAAASSATVHVARTTAGDLQIGTRVTDSSTTRFIGTVDEAYIYACEKTAAEILAYYNATKP